MTMLQSEMDRYLAGGPSKTLIRHVRRHLGRYGIRPQYAVWKLAWEWAAAIQRSYMSIPGETNRMRRARWPSGHEIGTQYIVLLLAEMTENFGLKMPYRAATHIPPVVAAKLPGGSITSPQLLLTQGEAHHA